MTHNALEETDEFFYTPQKEQLMYLLPEEGYKLLTHMTENGDESFHIKFKIVEWWQNRKESFPTENQYVLHE
jgi:tRNA splicing ligase